jgi:uncharacterized protein YbjT (DUF2867 family)
MRKKGVSIVNKDRGVALVIGAAEPEGAAVVRHLRERALPVRALLRSGDIEAAGRLRTMGVWPRFADLDDRLSVERAFDGVDALVVVIEEAEIGPGERLREGRVVADAARDAGLSQVVYVAGSGPDHHNVSCDRSREIEERMRADDLPLTVLRPSTLMEEIAWYWLSRFGQDLVLATPYEPDLPLPLVALDDIGALAALAVADPELFRGRTLKLAGDVATPRELARELSRALGAPVRVSEVQVEGVFMYPDAVGHAPDMEWLRTVYPPLQALGAWLARGGGSELCGQVARRGVA